jgi:ankyrin repeat protein
MHENNLHHELSSQDRRGATPLMHAVLSRRLAAVRAVLSILPQCHVKDTCSHPAEPPRAVAGLGESSEITSPSVQENYQGQGTAASQVAGGDSEASDFNPVGTKSGEMRCTAPDSMHALQDLTFLCARDKRGHTALHYACQLGLFDVYELLRNHGAPLDTSTPARGAAREDPDPSGASGCVNATLVDTSGAESRCVNASAHTSGEEPTMLALACKGGNVRLVKYMLRERPDFWVQLRRKCDGGLCAWAGPAEQPGRAFVIPAGCHVRCRRRYYFANDLEI